MAATLKSIAVRCGLDVSTVSRALRDDPRIREVTRRRVKREADKEKYVPHHYARGLKRGKTGMIWLLLPNLTNPLEQTLAQQASLRLRDAGYDLLVGAHYENEELYHRVLSRLEQRAADGVIVIPGWEEKSPETFNRLVQAGLPLIFMDRCITGVQAPVVTTDNRGAAAELVRRAADEGARGIVYLGHAKDTAELERGAGFREESLRRNLPLWTADEWAAAASAAPDSLLIAGSSSVSVAAFRREQEDRLASRRVFAGCFDGWRGPVDPFASVWIAHQDLPGIAAKAADLLTAIIRKEKDVPAGKVCIPCSSVQRLNTGQP